MTYRIAFTPGEPAGIGPDLAIALAQQPSDIEIVAIADPALLNARAAQLGQPLRLRTLDYRHQPQPLNVGELAVLPISTPQPVTPGRLETANAIYVLSTLDHAIKGCSEGQFAAMVTGPVQKSVINEAGFPFSGHTEYIADKTGTANVVMMLATEGLRVALATTHLPLAAIPSAITTTNLMTVIRILDKDLREKFGTVNPHILVCGLNPHAGENGHLGREEIDIIEPVIAQLQKEGLNLQGPLPADTLFTPKYLANADAVLAMYHDQGLPILKYKGFGRAVNITLGLPFIRTSVDHGTALDLAGSGKADPGSLETAIAYACKMIPNQKTAMCAP